MYKLSNEAIKSLNHFPVVSFMDYRRFITLVSQEYIAHGYSLMPDNVSSSEYDDRITLSDGTADVHIFTRKKYGDEVDNPSIVTAEICEDGETVFKRAFYPYSTDHRHVHNRGKKRNKPVRYCTTVEEWKKLAELKRKRFHCIADEDFVADFHKGCPGWDRIVKKVMPVVRSYKGYKRTAADLLEGVRISTKCIAISGNHDTILSASIYISGKKTIVLSNEYNVPLYYKKVHEVKSPDGRICIHGIYLPAWYAKDDTRRYRSTEVFKLRNEDGAAVSYLLESSHAVYGTTYMVLDNDGKMITNGYVPLEKWTNNVHATIGERVKPFFAEPVVVDDKNAFRTSVPLSAAVLLLMGKGSDGQFSSDLSYSRYDLAEFDKDRWNETEPICFEEDGIVRLYGKQFLSGEIKAMSMEKDGCDKFYSLRGGFTVFENGKKGNVILRMGGSFNDVNCDVNCRVIQDGCGTNDNFFVPRTVCEKIYSHVNAG